MPDIFRSWKTTVIGVGIVALCIVFVMGKITMEQFTTGFALLASGGFLASKDNSVSGK